ncbi:Protein FAM168A [Oryzias melastigma]|uniref:Protein FAM168A n=1 Tax=Oryzias melastigma TaxID=30732 RepID=A0A834BVV1_ORYME|nr:Protein FAM168A [Oryzias melastigma]
MIGGSSPPPFRLHPSIPPSFPLGGASPSPTRWPSLRVKAVFLAPVAEQNQSAPTNRTHSAHEGVFIFEWFRFAYPLPHLHTARMASGHPTEKFSFMYQPDTHKSKNRLSSAMNPVYSPVQPGTPYGNPKNMAFTGYPGAYPATAPTYTPNLYQTGSPGYPPGYTSAGTPYKVPPTQSNGAPPPYTPTTHPIPDSHVPHPQCLSSAEHIRTGSLLHSASVRSSATCDPSHHRGAAQQHPLHSALPRPRPRPRSSQQRHGGHGNGGRDDYGHECRDPVDNTPARSDWSTSSYGANLQAPRDTWLQLRTTSLVEPALRIWSPPSYATA